MIDRFCFFKQRVLPGRRVEVIVVCDGVHHLEEAVLDFHLNIGRNYFDGSLLFCVSPLAVLKRRMRSSSERAVSIYRIHKYRTRGFWWVNQPDHDSPANWMFISPNTRDF